MFFNRLALDSDIQEIKALLYSMDKKIDLMMDRSDTIAIMRLSESSLKQFLVDEPDLYTIEDVKSRSV